MNNLKTFHIIEVKYFSATNSSGSRFQMKSKRFNQSVMVSFDYSKNTIEDMAAEWLTAHGFNVCGIAGGYIVTDTFEPLKK